MELSWKTYKPNSHSTLLDEEVLVIEYKYYEILKQERDLIIKIGVESQREINRKQYAELLKLKADIKAILQDKQYLRTTSILASNPPQNAGVWDMTNAIMKVLED